MTLVQFPSRLMTRPDFEWWVNLNRIDVVTTRTPHLEPCQCGDINCHGWRFVACAVDHSLDRKVVRR